MRGIVLLATLVAQCEALAVPPTFFGRGKRASAVAARAVEAVVDADLVPLSEPLGEARTWRQLGSFEGVLSRRSRADKLDLPHVTVALINGAEVQRDQMVDALATCAAKHPLLRARISGTGPLDEDKIDANIRIGADPNPLSFSTMDPEFSLRDIADQALRSTSVCRGEEFEQSWQGLFDAALNEWEMDVEKGPLWRVSWLSSSDGAGCKHAVVILFNHAISDQTSANTLIQDLIGALQDAHKGSLGPVQVAREAPPTVEEAVLGSNHEPSPDVSKVLPGCGARTILYALDQVWHSLQGAPLLPQRVLSVNPADRELRGYGFQDRRTRIEFDTLDASFVKELLNSSRREDTTITGALVAAVWRAATASIETPTQEVSKLRILMSLDMRRFGTSNSDWTLGTMSCAGGATDFILKANPETSAWDLARRARTSITEFIESPVLPKESVRLFDVGSRLLDMVATVKSEGCDNLNSLGRAYSAGVSNAGLYSKKPPASDDLWAIERIHYGTSHSHTGVLFQLSAVTVGGQLCLTFQTPDPIVTEEEARSFRSRTIEELRKMCMS